MKRTHPTEISYCQHCGSGRIYRDRHSHLWCEDCEQWNGQVLSGYEQPSLWTPEWPGDPMGASL